MFHDCVKYREVHHHSICENLENEEIELVHFPSEDQIVNLMVELEKFREDLGVCSLSEARQSNKTVMQNPTACI